MRTVDENGFLVGEEDGDYSDCEHHGLSEKIEKMKFSKLKSLIQVDLHWSNGDVDTIEQIDSWFYDTYGKWMHGKFSFYGKFKITHLKEEVTMITAQEAAKQTEEAVHKMMTDELQKIEKGIMKLISEGKRSYSYDGTISSNAKEELKKLGYEVNTGSQYNESYVSIKW